MHTSTQRNALQTWHCRKPLHSALTLVPVQQTHCTGGQRPVGTAPPTGVLGRAKQERRAPSGKFSPRCDPKKGCVRSGRQPRCVSIPAQPEPVTRVTRQPPGAERRGGAVRGCPRALPGARPGPARPAAHCGPPAAAPRARERPRAPPRRQLIDEPRAFEERASAPKPLQSHDFSSSSAAWELCMFRHFSRPDSFLYQKTCSLELIGHPPPLPPPRRQAASTPGSSKGNYSRNPPRPGNRSQAPGSPGTLRVPFLLPAGLVRPRGLQPARHAGSGAGAPAKAHPPPVGGRHLHGPGGGRGVSPESSRPTATLAFPTRRARGRGAAPRPDSSISDSRRARARGGCGRAVEGPRGGSGGGAGAGGSRRCRAGWAGREGPVGRAAPVRPPRAPPPRHGPARRLRTAGAPDLAGGGVSKGPLFDGISVYRVYSLISTCFLLLLPRLLGTPVRGGGAPRRSPAAGRGGGRGLGLPRPPPPAAGARMSRRPRHR